MKNKSALSNNSNLSIRDYAMSNHAEYWNSHQEQLHQLIKQVTTEIEKIDQAALELKLPRNQEEAKKYKAIWVISGSGTYKIPITNTPGDALYKEKKWAQQTDRKRIDYAVSIIKKISLIASGQNPKSLDLSKEQELSLIGEFGPYLIYNGIPCQDDDLKAAIESGELNFPEEKLFIPDGTIARTIDQVANLKFPPTIHFDSGDKIGIITHSPHYPRLMRMVNKFKPIPEGVDVQLFPLVFENPDNEKEFAQSEMRGIVGYISQGLATTETYPYSLALKVKISEIEIKTRILPIDESDMKSVYDLSNRESIRKNSFNEKTIELESHKKWFKSKLKDDNIVMLKALFEENFAGQVRLEINGDSAIVGISVNDEFRGNGIASTLLQEIIKAAKTKGIKVIEAFIKPENQASIKLFNKVGFTFDQETEVSGKDALKYLYQIN